jgi:hypothetical protein
METMGVQALIEAIGVQAKSPILKLRNFVLHSGQADFDFTKEPKSNFKEQSETKLKIKAAREIPRRLTNHEAKKITSRWLQPAVRGQRPR